MHCLTHPTYGIEYFVTEAWAKRKILLRSFRFIYILFSFFFFFSFNHTDLKALLKFFWVMVIHSLLKMSSFAFLYNFVTIVKPISFSDLKSGLLSTPFESFTIYVIVRLTESIIHRYFLCIYKHMELVWVHFFSYWNISSKNIFKDGLWEVNLCSLTCFTMGFPCDPAVKNPPANESRRSLGVGNGNPFQFSCLENFHGERSLVSYSPGSCKDLDMTEHTHTYFITVFIFIQMIVELNI